MKRLAEFRTIEEKTERRVKQRELTRFRVKAWFTRPGIPERQLRFPRFRPGRHFKHLYHFLSRIISYLSNQMNAFNAPLNPVGKEGGKQGDGKGTPTQDHNINVPQSGAIPPIPGQQADQPAAPVADVIPNGEN